MQHHVRPTPCTHCGDTVLIAQQDQFTLGGFRFGKEPVARLEHAGAGPNDEVFDGVDDACERPPVTR